MLGLPNKMNKKGHLRSLTSHKGPDGETIDPRRNNGRRQPSASGKSGKSGASNRNDTFDQNELGKEQHTYGHAINQNDAENHEGKFLPVQGGSKPVKYSRGSHSENRQQNSKEHPSKSGHNVRASISKEVTTS